MVYIPGIRGDDSSYETVRVVPGMIRCRAVICVLVLGPVSVVVMVFSEWTLPVFSRRTLTGMLVFTVNDGADASRITVVRSSVPSTVKNTNDPTRDWVNTDPSSALLLAKRVK